MRRTYLALAREKVNTHLCYFYWDVVLSKLYLDTLAIVEDAISYLQILGDSKVEFGLVMLETEGEAMHKRFDQLKKKKLMIFSAEADDRAFRPSTVRKEVLHLFPIVSLFDKTRIIFA